MRIYVGNLDAGVTEDMLKNLFSPFGEVGKVTLDHDRRGVSKGFGFVEMPAADAAEAAVSGLNRTLFHDRTLDVCHQTAVPRGGPARTKTRRQRFRK
jgi:RNA recognition motif-containing protein